MEMAVNRRSCKIDPGRVVAAVFSRTGLARLSRQWRPSDACVLTFHGVSDGSCDDQLLDVDQHVHIQLFRDLCAHLASCYRVLPLSDIVAARQSGKSLPSGAVAITFDDGYASNYHLAYPVLKALGLPATIFAVAGYLDGDVAMWFHRIEMAFAKTQAPYLNFNLPGGLVRFELKERSQRTLALRTITASLKCLPSTELLSSLVMIERDLGVAEIVGKNYPTPLQPMTWDMARELEASGLIEMGGHTHSHPILSRCTDEQQAKEIRLSRERLTEELGRQPKTFAYTNGKDGDFNAASQRLLREEGFQAAFTMRENFLFPGENEMALPRFGCPSSPDYLEAIVSGSMTRFESLRKSLGFGRST